jgi:hypothetical protein
MYIFFLSVEKKNIDSRTADSKDGTSCRSFILLVLLVYIFKALLCSVNLRLDVKAPGFSISLK